MGETNCFLKQIIFNVEHCHISRLLFFFICCLSVNYGANWNAFIDNLLPIENKRKKFLLCVMELCKYEMKHKLFVDFEVLCKARKAHEQRSCRHRAYVFSSSVIDVAYMQKTT